ncbi:MAG TPA: hypothetical protein VFQ44_23715 [Streptosporangiaceae bacterium]|nr:hypothetical protein [Streptosporangiaceae bacterium]
MTTELPDGQLSEQAERELAKRLFNSAWELIDSTDRTPEQDRLMLVTACAAWLHWDAVGTDENRAIADWQIAHVASLLGYGELALAHATAAYELTRSANLPGWLRASALEGLARAHAVAGHQTDRDAYVRLATEALTAVTEPEERELIASQLATVPAAQRHY